MSLFTRTERFCQRFGMRVPILLAPMAGIPAPSLSAAVMDAGGLGACGVLLMTPEEIRSWVAAVRREADGPFQLNLWVPDPAPTRDAVHEAQVRAFLAGWGPPVSAAAAEVSSPDFDQQCEAMLDVQPAVVSSVMGVFAPAYVARLKAAGIAWFATASTVAEARMAAAAGADVIVAQGSEAGGHRGAFVAAMAERHQVGLLALLPAIVDAVDIPVVAAGGIADARGAAAALLLGASAVQIGTGFLRCPEAGLPAAWADALSHTAPEDTVVSRVFSGRAGRSLLTDFVQSALGEDAPTPAPYPIQRRLTAPMRKDALARGDVQRMQAWAGQSAALARAAPARIVVDDIWAGVNALLTAQSAIGGVALPRLATTATAPKRE